MVGFNFSLTSCTNNKNINSAETLKQEIVEKYKAGMAAYPDNNLNPRNIEPNGEVNFVKSSDWTSGFYPGSLWYIYELTGDTIFKLAAQKCTEILENEKFNAVTHDMGFKMYCSFGNGFRLTNDSTYSDILLQSAKTLITRFNPKVGCIRSWDHHAHLWQFPVIIDNMMNLELLFWAFHQTGDSVYYNIAVSHANKTIENHFRADFSSYHVINYDTLTGEVINKHTHQGIAHESAWARGQAWGLYGYALMYRETKDSAYLNQAISIADYILTHPNLPDDLIPYWDFNDPDIPNAPRDASAAAVISSALFELSAYVSDSNANYYSVADAILTTLSSSAYFAAKDAKHHFLLEHSTGNWPRNSEIDCPIIYADYYYLEALLRKQKFNK